MDDNPKTADSRQQGHGRWLRLSPDRFVLSLLLGVCLLWLSDRFQWVGFNRHKGWAVLIAVGIVGVAAIVMLVWWISALTSPWRFQLGIRSLLVFCLACSIVVGWFAVERERARRQAEMIEGINNTGGLVEYDWQLNSDGLRMMNPHLPCPIWLRTMLGIDFFSTIAGVGLDSDPFPSKQFAEHPHDDDDMDIQLKYLEGLTRLKMLDLRGFRFTDATLKHLKGLNQLQQLILHETRITDAGLEDLKGLSKLQRLWLSFTDVTDAGVKKLQQSLPNCEIIY